MPRALLLFSVALLASCGYRITSPGAATATVTTTEAQEIHTLVELINDHRRTVGCKPLIWNDSVAGVAEHHSYDMVHRNFFDHVNPDNKTPFDRLKDAKLKFRVAAENIAAGQRTGPEVFRSWIASSGHRHNIENCALREHGIGLVRGTPTAPYGAITNAWTHLFRTAP